MCLKIPKRRGGGVVVVVVVVVVVEYNSRETPSCATNQEDINDLLSDGYRFDNDIIPAPKNKPRYTS